MPNPTFTLFEAIAVELSDTNSRVLTDRDWERADENNPFLDELGRQYSTSREHAIPLAVADIERHFNARDSMMPFAYDQDSGRFETVDKTYLAFIGSMISLRSTGVVSKAFEIAVLQRLALRVTGSIHRVGFPRNRLRKIPACNTHLASLGFGNGALRSRQKDGGLDIIWILPLGAFPYKPLVIVQCKNGELNWKDADTSYASCHRTLHKHTALTQDAHLQCVLFNDYVTHDVLPGDAMQYVPLGLSDLASPLSATPQQVII